MTTSERPRQKIAYIIGRFPSLTTTFIDREIIQANKSVCDLILISIRHPGQFQMRPEIAKLAARTRYVLPAPWLNVIGAHILLIISHPWIFVSTLSYLVTRPHTSLFARFKTFLHFGEGVYTAALLRHDHVQHIHAHFADRAATLALVASRFLGVTYSFTAHATEIYVSPCLLEEKIGNAKFATTCTAYNKSHLEDVTGHRVELVYHGLDLKDFDGNTGHNSDPPLLLSVGQLKERKGFPVLLRACDILVKRGVRFRCEIVGDGPDRDDLTRLANELDLENTVEFLGALPNLDVMEKYRTTNIFALPCVVAKNDDRDGIPNVLLEAMAHQIPVVSTAISGIPEIIEHEVTGLLSEPGDEVSLANEIERLFRDRELCVHLGQNARQLVEQNYDIDKNISRLLEMFNSRCRRDEKSSLPRTIDS